MRVEHDRISLVPVIAVFTKYDQFRREIKYSLEKQGTDEALLNAEVKRNFEEQYVAKLPVSAPAVRLESERFVNQLACTTLISVPQECTSPAKSVLSLLKRLPMSSLATLLP